MCPFSSVATAGPSAGVAMLPYCFAPAAAAAMLPAGICAGNSTRARSSSVIFSVCLSSLFAIVSFGRVGLLLLLWLRRILLGNLRRRNRPILFGWSSNVRLQQNSTGLQWMIHYLLVSLDHGGELPTPEHVTRCQSKNNGSAVTNDLACPSHPRRFRRS